MLNTLALFGLPITTSTHPHRSNILGVKKWAWQDETQDSGHPPPSDAKLQISNQFGSFFSKKKCRLEVRSVSLLPFCLRAGLPKSCIMLMPPNGNPNEAFQEPQKA
jgi:hypothetical protein